MVGENSGGNESGKQASAKQAITRKPGKISALKKALAASAKSAGDILGKVSK
jgi:hypothetical protein